MDFGQSQQKRSETLGFPTELKRNAAAMGFSSNTKSEIPIGTLNQVLKASACSPIRFQKPKSRRTLKSVSKISNKPCALCTNEYANRNVQICIHKWLHFLKLRIVSCKFYKKYKELDTDDSLVKETITNTLVQVCQLFPDAQKLIADENKWCSCRNFSRNCPHCRNAMENSTSLDNTTAKLKQNFLKLDLSGGKSSSGYSSIKSKNSSNRRLSSKSFKNAALFREELTYSCELFNKKLEVFNKKNICKHPVKVLYKTNASNFDKNESKMEINISKTTNKAQFEKQPLVLTNSEKSFVEKYKNCKVTFRDGSLNFARDNWHDLPKKITSLELCDSKNNENSNNFFMSVISVYEKEQQFCNNLFYDKLFEKTLIMAGEDKYERGKKNKKAIFTRIIRKARISTCLRKKNKHYEDCKETRKNNNEELVEIQQNASSLASDNKKSFIMLAEAIKAKGTVDDILKICGLLRFLERIENRDFNMSCWNRNICEDAICAELVEMFANVYDFCRKEAKKHKKEITNEQLKLVKLFVIKHKMFELVPEINFVALKISNGFIETEEQLKNAVAFNLIWEMW